MELESNGERDGERKKTKKNTKDDINRQQNRGGERLKVNHRTVLGLGFVLLSTVTCGFMAINTHYILLCHNLSYPYVLHCPLAP